MAEARYLTWTRRKTERDYVATAPDGSKLAIFKGSRAWWLMEIGSHGFRASIQDAHGYGLPDYRTLADAKLAAEVFVKLGVEPLTAHRTEADSRLIGGGWGGHARSYGAKWTCSCGAGARSNAESVSVAREYAADHVRECLTNALRGVV